MRLGDDSPRLLPCTLHRSIVQTGKYIAAVRPISFAQPTFALFGPVLVSASRGSTVHFLKYSIKSFYLPGLLNEVCVLSPSRQGNVKRFVTCIVALWRISIIDLQRFAGFCKRPSGP